MPSPSRGALRTRAPRAPQHPTGLIKGAAHRGHGLRDDIEGRIVLNQCNRSFVFRCCFVSFALVLFLFRCGQSQEEQIKRSAEPSPDKAAVVKALGGRQEDAEPWT